MAGNDRFPPFMTDRSPSIERARREYEHPTHTGDAPLIALLAELCEAEQNAIDACDAVVARLTDPALVEQARTEADLHVAHRDALGAQITALGGSPPRPEECRNLLELHEGDSFETLRARLHALYQRTLPQLDEARRAAVERLLS